MRTTLLSVKLLLFGYLAYLLFILAFEYDATDPTFHPPFVLFVVDWIDLFIHEGGHFLFRIFGRWLYVLGGSLTQVLLPAALTFVTWRQSSFLRISLPLFWTGENLFNVSMYVRDAPYRKLHLLAKGLIHDWHWLLNGDPDAAELLGGLLYVLGIMLCVCALAIGVWSAVVAFREAAEDEDLALGNALLTKRTLRPPLSGDR